MLSILTTFLAQMWVFSGFSQELEFLQLLLEGIPCARVVSPGGKRRVTFLNDLMLF